MPLRPVSLLAGADDAAREVLGDHPDRLAHSLTASSRAVSAASTLGLDPDLLGAVALLHDIGYAADLAATGFHPYDGALHLARTGWPAAVVQLVAHHSHAVLVASAYGLEAQYRTIALPPTDLLDVLTWADVTSGLDGSPRDPEERIADMRSRHAATSGVPAGLREVRYGRLRRTAARVERRLAAR